MQINSMLYTIPFFVMTHIMIILLIKYETHLEFINNYYCLY